MNQLIVSASFRLQVYILIKLTLSQTSSFELRWFSIIENNRLSFTIMYGYRVNCGNWYSTYSHIHKISHLMILVSKTYGIFPTDLNFRIDKTTGIVAGNALFFSLLWFQSKTYKYDNNDVLNMSLIFRILLMLVLHSSFPKNCLR